MQICLYPFPQWLAPVYDVPFNLEHGLWETIDVLDVHGQPHQESSDAGFFPFYFFDYGKALARQTFLSIVERAVVNGSSDGVYVDCAAQKGLKCNGTSGECLAKRSGAALGGPLRCHRVARHIASNGLSKGLKTSQNFGELEYVEGAPDVI